MLVCARLRRSSNELWSQTLHEHGSSFFKAEDDLASDIIAG